MDSLKRLYNNQLALYYDVEIELMNCKEEDQEEILIYKACRIIEDLNGILNKLRKFETDPTQEEILRGFNIESVQLSLAS